ncbi:hypothetical protein LCM20_19825 [Halobacillus litoralis]|uniref:DUF6612 family protein n=1 Tax=Halobacillus litoralis TaxID=45668 RepID=UPI001CD4599B|nr:DUF6612 family protein [Halobacillus litoralis]MCA0972840.1 hypothetical protein [Halobacillus litoralis]
MRNKFMMLCGIIAMSLLLGACSSSEAQKLDEIFTKATEASESLESFSMDMVSEQEYQSEGEESNSPFPPGVPMTSEIQSDITMDPMAFHQTIKIDALMTEMEQYYTEDGLYIKSSDEESWMKAPKELLDQLNAISSQQQTPAEQLKNVEEYVDEFTLESDDDNYILSFSSKGEDLKKMMEETLNEVMPEGTMPEGMMDSVTFNSVEYMYTIDKETYYPKKMDMSMNITVEEAGEKMTIDQTTKGSYSNFNEIDEITIPDEVIENAKEMPGMGQTP